MALAVGLGSAAYPIYRAKLKQRIFIDAPTIGYLFERKEHLAFLSLVLAFVGGAFYLSARNGSERYRVLAQRTFSLSALAAWVTLLFGTLVAATKSL